MTGPLLGAVLNLYVERLAAEGKSPVTIRCVWAAFRRFLHFAGLELATPAAEVTVDHIARYREGLEAQRYARWTKIAWILHVRTFFRFAAAQGAILLDPTEDLKPPKVDRGKRQPVLSEEEVTRVLAATQDARDRAILEVLYGSALRKSECTQLRVEDLDLAGGTARVRYGKGGKERVVPVTAPAVEALRAYVGERREGSLWLSKRGKPLSDQSILLTAKRAGLRAGLAVLVSPHMLRRSCASHMLARGASAEAVRRLLGHATCETVHHYGVIQDAVLAATQAAHHPRG